jgi:5-methylcytosine-specific restriction endonuclease McrA
MPGPKSAALLAVCALARPAAGGCRWCGTPLPKGRRTWCQNRCATVFWNNHWWSQARRAAKRRDKYLCVRCGHKPPKKMTRAQRRTGRLEVNHRVPCLGQHGTLSCAHHLENLETLCVPCHRTRTAAQRERKNWSLPG